jgi:hypothetical protein
MYKKFTFLVPLHIWLVWIYKMASSSTSLQALADTTEAIKELQRCLEPWLAILRRRSRSGSMNDTTATTILTTGTSRQQHHEAMAQGLVALTLATICFMRPRLLRTSAAKATTTTTSTTTTTTTASSSNSQQQQIRSDLNHIRQLLKKLQESSTLSQSQDRNPTTPTIPSLLSAPSPTEILSPTVAAAAASLEPAQSCKSTSVKKRKGTSSSSISMKKLKSSKRQNRK